MLYSSSFVVSLMLWCALTVIGEGGRMICNGDSSIYCVMLSFLIFFFLLDPLLSCWMSM